MDISALEFAFISTYFIEISLLYETYPEKYQGYYLIFIDNIIDLYKSDIRGEMYDSYKRFRSKYNIQCPVGMSNDLLKMITPYILN